MGEMTTEAALALLDELATFGEVQYYRSEDVQALRTHLQALQARCEALQAIAGELSEHAQHHPDCDRVANGIDGDCWCGLFGTAERYEAIDSARKESEG